MESKYEIIEENNYETISGHSVRLRVNKFKDGLEINIKSDNKQNIYLKCCVILATLLYSCIFIENAFALSAILTLTALYIYRIFKYQQNVERLLVIKGVGYQIDSNCLFVRSTTFVPWDSVKDVFINEVITMQQVHNVLTIYNSHERTLIPLFTITRPRLQCLKTIYRILKQL